MITLAKHEFIEHISEILRMVKEEGVTFEIIDHGEVIARLVPGHEPEQPVEQAVLAFWRKIDWLAAQIGTSLPEQVDAVEIVRDGRHELPVSEPKQPIKRDTSEAWNNLKRLSAELSAHWPDGVSSVDAVRDVRDEFSV